LKKSFLEILDEENKAVADERFFADSLKDFTNYMEKEVFNVESYQRICADYEEKRKEAEKRVYCAKMEIREYLSKIQKNDIRN